MVQRINNIDSLRIRTLAATGLYTAQEIASDFEDIYKADQILRHLKTKDPDARKKLKREVSRGAVKLKSILTKIYPDVTIEDEYSVGERLRLDFYIPSPYNQGFEFDGIQHSKQTDFLHSSGQAFEDGKARDIRKQELCDGRGISLIRFSYDEEMTLDTVKAKIKLYGHGHGSIQEGFETNKEVFKERSIKQTQRIKDYKKKQNDKYKESSNYKAQKDKQKEYRKEQYKRQKEWLKSIKK